jgi:P-type Ca2+ transporter type 2C
MNSSKPPTLLLTTLLTENSNRRLDNKFNIFEGIQHNWFFIAINAIMVGGQILIVFVGGKAFHVTPLNGAQWGYSLVLGALSLPVAIIIRLIPDEWIANLVPKIWRRKLAPEMVARKQAKEEAKEELKERVEDLRRRASRPEDLSFINLVRGGRVRSLTLGLKTVNQTSMMITK